MGFKKEFFARKIVCPTVRDWCNVHMRQPLFCKVGAYYTWRIMCLEQEHEGLPADIMNGNEFIHATIAEDLYRWLESRLLALDRIEFTEPAIPYETIESWLGNHNRQPYFLAGEFVWSTFKAAVADEGLPVDIFADIEGSSFKSRTDAIAALEKVLLKKKRIQRYNFIEKTGCLTWSGWSMTHKRFPRAVSGHWVWSTIKDAEKLEGLPQDLYDALRYKGPYVKRDVAFFQLKHALILTGRVPGFKEVEAYSPAAWILHNKRHPRHNETTNRWVWNTLEQEWQDEGLPTDIFTALLDRDFPTPQSAMDHLATTLLQVRFGPKPQVRIGGYAWHAKGCAHDGPLTSVLSPELIAAMPKGLRNNSAWALYGTENEAIAALKFAQKFVTILPRFKPRIVGKFYAWVVLNLASDYTADMLCKVTTNIFTELKHLQYRHADCNSIYYKTEQEAFEALKEAFVKLGAV